MSCVCGMAYQRGSTMKDQSITNTSTRRHDMISYVLSNDKPQQSNKSNKTAIFKATDFLLTERLQWADVWDADLMNRG